MFEKICEIINEKMDIDVSEINVGKSTEYKRIGYEDRLKEVL